MTHGWQGRLRRRSVDTSDSFDSFFPPYYSEAAMLEEGDDHRHERRKSIQPMAGRIAVGEYDQLHHFIAAPGCGMRRLWRRNCLFKQIGWSAVAMPKFGGVANGPDATRERRGIKV